MSDYINRELSWLEFNQRVLNQALRRELPLLERVKFLGITASNLDEFFQVRVGGLQMLKRSGSRAKDVSGLTPARQLQLIRKRVGRMIDDQYNLFTKELLPAMQSEGISPIPVASLTETQLLALGALFHDQIFPLLTPLDMDRETPPCCLRSISLWAYSCTIRIPGKRGFARSPYRTVFPAGCISPIWGRRLSSCSRI